MIENKIKDDFHSFVTSNQGEDIIRDINNHEKNNISIITNSFEKIVPNILSFLIEYENTVNDKIKIVRFLQNLFIKNEMNSEIFSRICQFHNMKLNLFQIIIHEYLIYRENSKHEDVITYRRELLVLFDILLTQITFDRESYHYILSFMIIYLNKKNNNLDSDQNLFFNSEFLNRILLLLKKFYHPFDTSKFYGNYFFFTGGSSSSIIIQNKNNSKDNKKY